MPISFDSCERVKGVGGKIGLSDAVADDCWLCRGRAAPSYSMLEVVNEGLLPALLVGERSYLSERAHCKDVPLM